MKKSEIRALIREVLQEDESDYYSPEAKAERAMKQFGPKPRKELLGVRLYDVGLKNTHEAMANYKLKRFSGGQYGLPYYGGDDDATFKKNLAWLENYFGAGHWKLKKKSK